MFSTTGLFKGIACPEGERCAILNCIFSHDLRPKASDLSSVPHLQNETKTPVEFSDGNATKRRKLEHDSEPLVSATSTPVSATPGNLTNSSFGRVSATGKYQPTPLTKTPTQPVSVTVKTLQTLNKPVSPPPIVNTAKTNTTKTKAPPKPESKETLNPRMIPYDPAGHAKRTLFLHHLHANVKRLNDEVAKSSLPKKAFLTLTDNELIKAALDEEEKIARENSKVYANIVKNRIAAYKKMKVEEWVTHVMATLRIEEVEKGTATPPPIDTGLPLDQEYMILPHLVTDQAPLAKHGYVPAPPSANEIAEAEAAVAASMNYEVCDRCKSRFRVFTDRREVDGALTTNGPCYYHWQKPFTPRREKTDAIKGQKETFHPCCGESLGTKGCTECETHVFKVSDANRLAAVIPFINTPENPNPAKGPDGKPPSGVTFDCEMGYTVFGFELIRLTAVSWPEGYPLVDVLVRPRGTILDLNSRWSGVWPDAYAAAIPYAEKTAMDALLPPPPPGSDPLQPATGPIPIVSSVSAARDLLCSFITPSIPLIGHALENDLNSVRLCHPTIIDTIVLFPHPRGLPLRFGLKMLVKRHLGRDIQLAGDQGHDSLEDARSTGDLVRWAVGERVRKLRREGWSVGEGILAPPLPPGLPPLQEGERVLGGGTGFKRQRIEVEETPAKEFKE